MERNFAVGLVILGHMGCLGFTGPRLTLELILITLEWQLRTNLVEWFIDVVLNWSILAKAKTTIIPTSRKWTKNWWFAFPQVDFYSLYRPYIPPCESKDDSYFVAWDERRQARRQRLTMTSTPPPLLLLLALLRPLDLAAPHEAIAIESWNLFPDNQLTNLRAIHPSIHPGEMPIAKVLKSRAWLEDGWPKQLDVSNRGRMNPIQGKVWMTFSNYSPVLSMPEGMRNDTFNDYKIVPSVLIWRHLIKPPFMWCIPIMFVLKCQAWIQ